MTRLNDGVPRRIASTQPFGFEVVLAEGEAAEGYGRHTGGGMVSQRKVPSVVSFAPLSARIPQPLPADDPMGMLITPDLGKWGRSEQLHAFFQALGSFRERHAGDLPAPRNAEHAAEVVALAKEFAASLKDKEGALQLEAVDEAALARLAAVAAYELPALGTFFSGVLAQELVKLTGKYAPLRQWLYYDCAEVLAKPEAEAAALAADPAEFTPRGSRYDHNIGLFGRSLQDKLLGTKVFLVGCGALGCELIKNFALMGVGCGPEGRVTATDMDIIETSNLSRQFLYRARHVGSAKSVTACNEVRVRAALLR
jgi:ubiquitin-activating enzyme E1